MIIVTGGTGRLGSRIVDRLLDRVPAEQVGISVRDPARVQPGLSERGVRVRRGDYAEPDSLADAFEGVSQVLLVSADQVGAAALGVHRAAIDAAVSAGAERILYTSHQAASAGSAFAPANDHAATEQHLAGCGVAWTSLRNGFHANTVTDQYVARALASGEIAAPRDGRVSWTTRDDLAEAAAVVLAEAGRFDGPTPPLTASEALDLGDVARLLTELTGTSVRRVVLEDAEWCEQMVAGGVPEEAATMLLGLYQASRAGEMDVVDPTLAELVGRPGTSMRTVLEQHLSGR